MNSELPRRTRSNGTDRIGVAKTDAFFSNTRRWAFREQPIEDFGIDAQIEFAPDEQATGRLIALQIKSGDSYLKPSALGGWYFYPETKHVSYWTQHSLPVVVVFWREASDELFAVEASTRTLERTAGVGWRLPVRESNKLDAADAGWLERLSDGNPYDLRIRELRLLLPLMHRIQGGARVLVKADEWVNKSLNKRHLSIIEVADDGAETLLAEWGAFTGPGGYQDLFRSMFRWAELTMDPDVAWEAEDYWADEPDDGEIGPYTNVMGEVDKWSLELHIGELAKAFMLVDDYARTGDRQLGIPLDE